MDQLDPAFDSRLSSGVDHVKLDYGRAPTQGKSLLWARILGALVGLFLLLLSLSGLAWMHGDTAEVAVVVLLFLTAALILWMSLSGRALGKRSENRKE